MKKTTMMNCFGTEPFVGQCGMGLPESEIEKEEPKPSHSKRAKKTEELRLSHPLKETALKKKTGLRPDSSIW